MKLLKEVLVVIAATGAMGSVQAQTPGGFIARRKIGLVAGASPIQGAWLFKNPLGRRRSPSDGN